MESLNNSYEILNNAKPIDIKDQDSEKSNASTTKLEINQTSNLSNFDSNLKIQLNDEQKNSSLEMDKNIILPFSETKQTQTEKNMNDPKIVEINENLISNVNSEQSNSNSIEISNKFEKQNEILNTENEKQTETTKMETNTRTQPSSSSTTIPPQLQFKSKMIPNAPNWYCSKIADVNEQEGLFCFGAKNSIFVCDIQSGSFFPPLNSGRKKKKKRNE